MLNEKPSASAPLADEYSPANTNRPAAPARFDPKDYAEHLSASGLTEQQQRELLQTLWNIMSTFVNIGWGVDTVQLVLPELFGTVATESDTRDKGGGHD